MDGTVLNFAHGMIATSEFVHVRFYWALTP
jgi:hypothetical protein